MSHRDCLVNSDSTGIISSVITEAMVVLSASPVISLHVCSLFGGLLSATCKNFFPVSEPMNVWNATPVYRYCRAFADVASDIFDGVDTTFA